MQIVMGTSHLVNISGISSWAVTGTCFVGSSHWKIPRKSGKSKKVGPLSQLQFANRILCSIYTFLVVCTSSRSMVGHCDLPEFTTKWNNFLPGRNSTFLPPKFPFFFLNGECPTFEHVAQLDLQIETKLKMAKRIAMVSGIFLKGRRQTLLYSFKWQ